MPGEDKCFFAVIETEEGKNLLRGCTKENLPETTCKCLPEGGYVCSSGYGQLHKTNLI